MQRQEKLTHSNKNMLKSQTKQIVKSIATYSNGSEHYSDS